MNIKWFVSTALAIILAGGMAAAQEASPGKDYVTREEYDKLKGQMDKVLQQLEQVQKQQKEQAANAADIDKVVDEIQHDIKANHDFANTLHSGFQKILVAGDGDFGFTSQHGSHSTFEAGIAPLILWELNDRILIETAFDIGIGTQRTVPSGGGTLGDPNSSTTFDLTLANITYIVNDNLYVGGGLFAVPFGRYHPHFDPSWINRLPDDPLVYGDRSIAPGSEVGIFAGGAAPIGSMKINYNAYVSNGPNLVVSDPGSAGSLNFSDYTDLNANKAVGGRIGFLPIPELEIGYSIQYSQPNPDDFQKVHALLQGVDVQYKRDIDAIRGTLDLRAEWVWSNVGRATYDTGTGPFTFSNVRNGGYVQAGYRPSKVNSKFLRDLEFLVRYDRITVPAQAPGGGSESRWAMGVDYWLTPSVVLKVAYEFDHKELGGSANGIFFQCGFGL